MHQCRGLEWVELHLCVPCMFSGRGQGNLYLYLHFKGVILLITPLMGKWIIDVCIIHDEVVRNLLCNVCHSISVLLLNFYNCGVSAECIITCNGERVDVRRKCGIWHVVVVYVWKAFVETEGNRVPADGVSISLARWHRGFQKVYVCNQSPDGCSGVGGCHCSGLLSWSPETELRAAERPAVRFHIQKVLASSKSKS